MTRIQSKIKNWDSSKPTYNKSKMPDKRDNNDDLYFVKEIVTIIQVISKNKNFRVQF